METRKFQLRVAIPKYVPEEYRQQVITDRFKVLADELWKSVDTGDGNMYTVRVSTNEQKILGDIVITKSFDIAQCHTMDVVIPKLSDMPTKFVVESAVDELKSRIKRWVKNKFIA